MRPITFLFMALLIAAVVLMLNDKPSTWAWVLATLVLLFGDHG